MALGPMRQERIDRSYFKMDPVERDARIRELAISSAPGSQYSATITSGTR
jgi:hypothetical protein